MDENLPGSLQLPRLLHSQSSTFQIRDYHRRNFGCVSLGALLQSYRGIGSIILWGERSLHLLHSLHGLSPTLRSLRFRYYFARPRRSSTLFVLFPFLKNCRCVLQDISNGKTLPKDVEFRLCIPRVEWINTALGTVKSEHLQQITVYLLTILLSPADETTRLEGQDLSHLLVPAPSSCP